MTPKTQGAMAALAIIALSLLIILVARDKPLISVSVVPRQSTTSTTNKGYPFEEWYQLDKQSGFYGTASTTYAYLQDGKTVWEGTQMPIVAVLDVDADTCVEHEGELFIDISQSGFSCLRVYATVSHKEMLNSKGFLGRTFRATSSTEEIAGEMRREGYKLFGEEMTRRYAEQQAEKKAQEIDALLQGTTK